MKILIDINHPAHVHLFKHFAWQMMGRGHHILFTAREKDVAIDLLRQYNFQYIDFGKHYKSLLGKLTGLIKYDSRMLRVMYDFKPDLVVSMGSIYASHAAWLMRKVHIAFEDSEPVPEHQILYVPFTRYILTPRALNKDFGQKHIRYDGFHEIAYLHPNYFNPDPKVLRTLGIDDNERYAILRFVRFAASHDIGINGFTMEDKLNLVNRLEKYGRVFITSESSLPPELEPYRISIEPSCIHDAMYYASLYVGDSQTMATEAALLGTPTVRCNSFAKSNREMSNFIEMEKYGLMYNFNIKDKETAMEQAELLFSDPAQKQSWRKKCRRLFSDKIDVTKFIIWFVEQYPDSVSEFRTAGQYPVSLQHEFL